VADALPGTVLEPGRVVPGAPLADARTGHDVSAWSLRGRGSMVIAFVHAGCPRCANYIGRLERREPDLQTADGQLLVVEDGSLSPWLGEEGQLPLVLVVDRDGAAWRSYPASLHDFPEPAEVVATVWHLATMCPECGVPTAEWAE
jgi:hypothetical protein